VPCPADDRRMKIVINVAKSTTGRLAGTVRPSGSTTQAEFDGTMELLAALERLCAVDDRLETP
jgi:hypothetical protein